MSLPSVNRVSALRAHRKYGPDLDDELMSLIHPQRCPCCDDSDYGVSARAARIEIPLRTIFASTAAFASPALADDTEAPTSTEAKPDTPATEEKKPAEEEKKPTEEEKKPAEEEKKPAEEEKKSEEKTESKSEAAAEESKPVGEAESKPVAEEESKPDSPLPGASKPTFKDSLKKYFPKALPTSIVAAKVENALSPRKFTKQSTLFGTCVCPDEINNKPGKSLPAALQNAMTDLNGVFHLGGLAGLPYMGPSGMKAFLSHTPSNGKVFIMYGPHVGITDEGVVGSVERLGKTSATLDCDTTLNALKVAQTGGAKATKEDAKKAKVRSPDKREEYIVAKLRTALDSKQASNLSKDDLPAFATYKMFDLVRGQIMKQLQASLKDEWDANIDEIVLLGGIIVNRGQLTGSIEPREDYFEPLVFDSYSGALADTKDLFQPVFGAKIIPFYEM